MAIGADTGWRRRIARLALGLALTGVAAAALIAFAVVLLRAGIERDRVVELAERQIAERLGASVEIGAIDGSLYPSAELRDVRVSWPEATLQIPRVTIRYALHDLLGRTRLQLESVAIESPRLELSAIPSLPAPERDDPARIDVDLASLEITDAEIRWPGSALGSVTARLRLSTRDWALTGRASPSLPAHAALTLTADIELARTVAAAQTVLALRSELELSGSELRITRLDLDGAAGQLASQGRATLDGAGVRTLALDAQAAHLDLAPLLDMPGLRTDLGGTIGLRAERDRGASWQEAHASGQARLEGRAAGDAIQSIEVDASVARQVLQIARADVRGPALELHAQGVLADEAALDLRGSVPDLSRLQIASLSLGRVAGALAFDGKIRGPRQALEGSFSVQVRKLALASRPLGQLDVRLAVRGKRLQIEQAKLVHGQERLELAGALDLSEPREPRAEALRARLENLDLASLDRAIEPRRQIRGRVSGSASLEGTLRQPRVSAALQLQSARIDRWAADRLDLELDLQQRWRGRLRADLQGKLGSAELRFDLPAPPDTDLRESWKPWLAARDGSIELDGKQLDVALVAPFLPKAVHAASGRIDLELRAAGGWPPSTLTGHARGEDLKVALGEPSRSFGPARAEIELGPRVRSTGSVEFRARVDLPDAWLGRAAGRVQLRPDLAASKLELTDFRLERQQSVVTLSGSIQGGKLDPLRVEIEALDIAALPALEGLEQLGGQLDAQLLVRGSLQQPTLSGAAVWEQPRVGAARAERVMLEWSTSDGKLTGDARIVEGGAVVASAQLRAPAPTAGESYAEALERQGAEARVDTNDLDIGLLSPFLSGFARDVRGRVTLHAEASGDPWQPSLSGRLSLHQGSVRIPALGQTFTPIEAELIARNDALRIEKLSFSTVDGGNAELTGRIGLDALTPKTLDARIELDGLTLVRTGGTRVNVDGSVTLDGPFDGLRFAGELALRESRFGVPGKDDPLAREIRILRSGSDPAAILSEEPSTPQLWLQRSAGTLRLQVPSNTWIRGAGAELELAGVIELRKQPLEEPLFFGALDVVRGEYRFAGRTLEVESGGATFTGSRLLDPQLDVRATTDVDDYHVTILLSGPLSNPNLQPTSDPPLPRNDVLALLLFGSASRDIGAERALALDLALAQLGKDFAADELTDRVSSHLPFDTFRLGVAEDGSGATLEIGRYLRKDVFVRYEQTLGSETRDTIVLEWRFTPTLRIESSTSSRTGSGADLIWRKDY